MISIKELVISAWDNYEAKFWFIIKLQAINLLAFIALIPFGLVWIATMDTSWGLVFLLIELLILLGSIYICFATSIAMIFLAKEKKEDIAIKKLLELAMPKIVPFFWVGLLTGLAVFGGFLLFIIPAIIFGVWFSMSKYVLIAEGVRGTLALKRSKELVKGKWLPVFGRLLVVWIIMMAVSNIPVFGTLLAFIFAAPFSVIYAWKIYEDLSRVETAPAI